MNFLQPTSRIHLFIAFIFVIAYGCKESNEELIDRANDLREKNNRREAIALYTKVIGNNPRIELAYFNRGLTYFDLKEYSNALKDFNKIVTPLTNNGIVLRMNKNSPGASEEVRGQVSYYDALYQRAQVYYYMDSLRNSFLDFGFLIKDFYHESNCLNWQGIIWVRNGSKEKACKCFMKAKELALTETDKQDADSYISDYCK